MAFSPPLHLGELAGFLGAELRGDAKTSISGLARLNRAGAGELSFLADPKYRKCLADTKAAAVILKAEDAEGCPVPCLVAADPYLAYAKVSQIFEQGRESTQHPGVHPSATVEEGVQLGEDISIGPHCHLEREVRIGDGTRLGPGVVVGWGSALGENCILHANVTLVRNVTLGSRVILHSGAVIGAAGFGNAWDGKKWERIAQLGGVCIGDDTEIGANTSIDRGALGDTCIGRGCRIDNQVHIAHNARIGEHTAIAGCTGIAGGAEVGARCRIGGAVGIANQLRVADDVTLLARTFVSRSITAPGVYASTVMPEPATQWRRNALRLRELDALFRRVARLEKSSPDERAKKNDNGH